MKKLIDVLFVFGTRPEIIKLSPIINMMVEQPCQFLVRNISTGQHRQMGNRAMIETNVHSSFNMILMEENQTVHSFVGKAIQKIPEAIESLYYDKKPDYIIIQGDTASAYAGAMAGFLLNIPIIHIEAGLRTYDMTEPFPEEMFRRQIDQMAYMMFAPTNEAECNCIMERPYQWPEKRIIENIGNTCIDALLKNLKSRSEVIHDNYFNMDTKDMNIITVELHRRESFGKNMNEMFESIKELAKELYDHQFYIIMHQNPNVREAIDLSGLVELAAKKETNVRLFEPVNYHTFIRMLLNSDLVITDSGGVQEEVTYLGIPTIVARNTSERSDGDIRGCVRQCGNSGDEIFSLALHMIKNGPKRYAQSLKFGDGYASEKICKTIIKDFNGET